MVVRAPRYSKDEFSRRGDEIYESQVRSQVEEGNHGKIVVIDLETGAFEVGMDETNSEEVQWPLLQGYRAMKFIVLTKKA